MGIHQLREGEHASLFYDRPAELLESLIPAVREALSSGEQCIYLADEPTAAHVTSALGATVDVSEARDRRALRLVTQRDGFCPTGTFRAGEMAAFLERSIAEGLADGFPGVVVAEDVAWVLGREDRLGMCVTVRVEQAGLTPTDLLPVLPEVGPLMDECEVLSGADRGVSMSITKWVRDHPSAREARLVLPSWERETDAARGSEVRPQREELVDFFENAPVPMHWVAEDGRVHWA